MELSTFYRDQCKKLEAEHGSMMPCAKEYHIGRKSPAEVSWEAFGLASDLRNASASYEVIEQLTGINRRVVARRWRRYFPELIDANKDRRIPGGHLKFRHPQLDQIEAALARGTRNCYIREQFNLGVCQLAGIRWRWRKKNDRHREDNSASPRRARLPLRFL